MTSTQVERPAFLDYWPRKMVSPELAAWCDIELERQFADEVVPELGFDMFTGEVRAVAHCLLDTLDAVR